MALLTDHELHAIRERHERAVLQGVDTVASASAAHDDRERLLDAAERLVPVFDAARVVEGLIQRGSLPATARAALLELRIALRAVTEEADVIDTEGEVAIDADDGELVRLSA